MATESKIKTTYETKVITATLDAKLEGDINIIDIEGKRFMLDNYSNRIMSLDAISDTLDNKYSEADSESTEETMFALMRDFIDQFKA